MKEYRDYFSRKPISPKPQTKEINKKILDNFENKVKDESEKK